MDCTLLLLELGFKMKTCRCLIVQLLQISKNLCMVHYFVLNPLQNVLQPLWDRPFLQLILNTGIFSHHVFASDLEPN